MTTTSAVSSEARMRLPSLTLRRDISFCSCVRSAEGDGSPPVPFRPVTSPTPRTVMIVLPWTLMYSESIGVLMLVPKSSSSSSSFDFADFFLSLSLSSLSLSSLSSLSAASRSLSLPNRSASIAAPGMDINPAAQPHSSVDDSRPTMGATSPYLPRLRER